MKCNTVTLFRFPIDFKMSFFPKIWRSLSRYRKEWCIDTSLSLITGFLKERKKELDHFCSYLRGICSSPLCHSIFSFSVVLHGPFWWHTEWYCWKFRVCSRIFSSENPDHGISANFFVCSEKMLSIEYAIKRECFGTRRQFCWKLFLGVRSHDSLWKCWKVLKYTFLTHFQSS